MAREREPVSRRRFIQSSAAGIAGASIAVGTLLSPRPARAVGYLNGSPINPNIDNTRVVFVHDPNMTTDQVVTGWTNQNTATHAAVVEADIDKMACALAEEANVADAWHKILLLPPGKTWNQVVVAIKTNCIAIQRTRDAVMTKMCKVLINQMGVLGSNIHVYDGVDGGNMPAYGCFAALGVNKDKKWGGVVTPAYVPPPIDGNVNCVQSITNGTVDILINIALSKGHSTWNGNLTQCMKNHYGTFDPINHSDMNLVFGINRSETILGKMNPDGTIQFPRQQLCLIDALWSSSSGPSGDVTDCPNRLFMGTFAPVLDYLVAKRFRGDTMGYSIVSAAVDTFLSQFGYSDPGGNTLQMIDAMTWAPTGVKGSGADWREY